MVRIVAATAFVNPCAFFPIASPEVEIIAGLGLRVVPNTFVRASVPTCPGTCVADKVAILAFRIYFTPKVIYALSHLGEPQGMHCKVVI